MDKEKKVIYIAGLALVAAILLCAENVRAQDVTSLQFCDKKYEYAVGKDSISLFFNMLDSDGRVRNLNESILRNYLVFKEDDKFIPLSRMSVSSVNSGQRIPDEYTFSVLVDLSIPEGGKNMIYDAVGNLVENAPDSSVFISFFGDEVTSSVVVTKGNYQLFRDKFMTLSARKYFYSGLYSKLIEFSNETSDVEKSFKVQDGYERNRDIAGRAAAHADKNFLFVFTEGSVRPSDEDVMFVDVVHYQQSMLHDVPRVMALYYVEDGGTPEIETTLKGICSPRDESNNLIESRTGRYLPSNDLEQVLSNFQEVVNDAMYDYVLSYKVGEEQTYARTVKYTAEWKGTVVGEVEYTIGTAERAWPIREEDTADIFLKILWALIITFLTAAVFFFVAKIIVPWIKSKSFEFKYYKKYVPDANVSRRICHYCKQEIKPGQYVVTKCKHIQHVACWQQNGYKCAEYGQNCKSGIQNHIEWGELFTANSFKSCFQAFSGILAGFICWVFYEMLGIGVFEKISGWIVGIGLSSTLKETSLYVDCMQKTSSFLMIGLLLGFFLSMIFRLNDEFKSKDWRVCLKIFGLSLFSALVGIVSFAIGANILCLLVSLIGTAYMPWYCSFPAYLLFSICFSLSLSVKSTIPMKNAVLGGLCAAVIGFIVLYFSSFLGKGAWMNMLLDFVIYGGGLGASLVTVRMLAEKYFLVIKNGIKSGQRIPIHKWMNATGGLNKVSIGMTGDCEIQMNWEKSNKVAKEHVQLFVDYERRLPIIKPLATGVIYNMRAELPVGKDSVLSNGDEFKIGDTIFQYVETE